MGSVQCALAHLILTALFCCYGNGRPSAQGLEEADPGAPEYSSFLPLQRRTPSSPFWISDWFHLFISSPLNSSRTLRPFHWSPEATRVQLGQEQMVAQTVDGEDSTEFWGPQGKNSPSGRSE